MKQVEEYLKQWSFYGQIPTRELEAILKEMQEDTIRETVKECAGALRKVSYPSSTEQEQNAIISVADKLIKEL